MQNWKALAEPFLNKIIAEEIAELEADPEQLRQELCRWLKNDKEVEAYIETLKKLKEKQT